MDSLFAQMAHPINLAKRLKRKTVILLAAVCWLAFVNYWLYVYRNNDVHSDSAASSIYFDEGRTEPDKPVEDVNDANKSKGSELINHFLFKTLQGNSGVLDTRGYDSHSTVYDKIFADHDVNSVLANLDFRQRCDLYFLNLYASDPNWKINPKEDLPVPNRDHYDFDRFRGDVMGKVKEEIAKEKNIDKDAVPEDRELEDKINEKYKEMWAITHKTEQKSTDYVSHFRIFNKCFITADDHQQQVKTTRYVAKQKKLLNSIDKSQDHKGIDPFRISADEARVDTTSFDSCSQLESRIYPWLSTSYPLFERWDGKIHMTPPIMSKYVHDRNVLKHTNEKAWANRNAGAEYHSKLTGGKACFLNKLKNSLNGRGIVMSIGDKHVDDTVRLIRLLRALGNKYPIQIVYNDDISTDTKKKIVTAARNLDMTPPSSYSKVSEYLTDDYLSQGKLPPQEVWFVNAHSVIQDEYKGKFHGFSNKFLAMLFNSFEEYILIDADTIMVQNPDFYFNFKGYIEKGAFFFKDRTAPQFRQTSDGVFFKKISPSLVDSAMFDIPIITKHTLEREYFDGMTHYMESGLLVIDRNRHFNSVLMMIQMNFMNPVTTRSYGDKEIIWLAFVVNGDEEYHFNKYFAAAIGSLTPDEQRLNGEGKTRISKEICSAHPGHLSEEDGSLVWFNSGYHTCGQLDRINYEEEAKKQLRFKQYKTAEQFKVFYESPLEITHAIVPPFKNKLETLCENTIDEPKEGWIMDHGYCHSYLWCAYSQIGGPTKDNEDNTQVGKVFTFSKKASELFKFYGDVWVGTE